MFIAALKCQIKLKVISTSGMLIIARSQGNYPVVNMIFPAENVAVFKKSTVLF